MADPGKEVPVPSGLTRRLRLAGRFDPIPSTKELDAMMRLLILALLMATPTTTHAGWFCRRARQAQPRVVYQQAVATPQAPAPAPTPAVHYQLTADDGPAAFLGALNLWRSWYGRAPVGWDAGLAALAASNTRVHDGQPNQCWSSTTSLMASLRMWQASPAHAAILLNATIAVGASPCPSGCTANAR